jgi:transcriptional regulator of acetoin/glycerol metabolism
MNRALETTLRLDESLRQTDGSGRLAIRWLTAGATSPWLPIDGARITIGRGPGVTVPLEAAGLSRCHVEIYRQGPACIAHDLESTNGTYVNARRVQYAPLTDGDVLRLGDVVGVVVRTPATEARTGADDLVAVGPEILFGPGLTAQLDQIRRVAPSDLPVTIVGETGAGKEYVAQAVHLLSGRRGRFHAVNCAALPAALAEAELFGHSKGAFTGADHAGLGQVRAADGGTLFLDELPELPPPVQAKLLRVLQERQVTPLGETRAIDVDLRVVAACQQPLETLVSTRRLREDLAARIAGLTVVVTPLRQRRLDIGLFFQHFLDRQTAGRAPAVDPRLLECLLIHDWPGNVRELDLLTRRLVALHGHEPLLRRSFLPEALRARVPPATAEADASTDAGAAPAGAPPATDRDQHDRRRLAGELRRLQGNVTRAATAAGISRARAYRLMGGRTAPEFLADTEDPAAAPAEAKARPKPAR